MSTPVTLAPVRLMFRAVRPVPVAISRISSSFLGARCRTPCRMPSDTPLAAAKAARLAPGRGHRAALKEGLKAGGRVGFGVFGDRLQLFEEPRGLPEVPFTQCHRRITSEPLGFIEHLQGAMCVRVAFKGHIDTRVKLINRDAAGLGIGPNIACSGSPRCSSASAANASLRASGATPAFLSTILCKLSWAGVSGSVGSGSGTGTPAVGPPGASGTAGAAVSVSGGVRTHGRGRLFEIDWLRARPKLGGRRRRGLRSRSRGSRFGRGRDKAAGDGAGCAACLAKS